MLVTHDVTIVMTLCFTPFWLPQLRALQHTDVSRISVGVTGAGTWTSRTCPNGPLICLHGGSQCHIHYAEGFDW
jgi:hypothetical protein